MSLNRGIFTIHSFLGLISGIFILIFSLTGAVIVFYDELNKTLYSELLITENEDKNRITLDEAYQIVCKKYPTYHPFRINQGINNNSETIGVGLQKNNFAERFSVYLNPYSGKILGELKNPFTLIAIKLHYSFCLGKLGELLAAIFALSFLGSIVTGIFIYRKNFFKVLLFKVPIKLKNWRTASSDLHRVLGVWALIFNFLLAFSGFWMMKYSFDFKKHFANNENIAAPEKLLISIDHYLEESKKNIPGVNVIYISLPRKQGDYLSFWGDTPGNWLLGEYNNIISYNSQTGILEKVIRENELSLDKKFEKILQTLHFGKFGGMSIQIIYFFFSIATAIITITGFFLWKRRQNKKPTRKIKREKYVKESILLKI